MWKQADYRLSVKTAKTGAGFHEGLVLQLGMCFVCVMAHGLYYVKTKDKGYIMDFNENRSFEVYQ